MAIKKYQVYQYNFHNNKNKFKNNYLKFEGQQQNKQIKNIIVSKIQCLKSQKLNSLHKKQFNPLNQSKYINQKK